MYLETTRGATPALPLAMKPGQAGRMGTTASPRGWESREHHCCLCASCQCQLERLRILTGCSDCKAYPATIPRQACIYTTDRHRHTQTHIQTHTNAHTHISKKTHTNIFTNTHRHTHTLTQMQKQKYLYRHIDIHTNTPNNHMNTFI